MKNLMIIFALAAMLFCGYANAEVKEVTITGCIDLDLLWRENTMDFENDTKDQAAYGELEVNVVLDITLTDNVTAQIELEEGMLSVAADADNIAFNIDEAYITIKEFLWEELTMQIGKMPLKYGIRGKNGEKSLRRYNNWIIGNADPLGIFFNIDWDQWQVDFFWLKLEDASKLGTNPRAMHVGDETGNSADDDLYGLVVSRTWNEVNIARGMFLYWNLNNSNSSVLNSLGATQTAEFDCPMLVFGVDLYFLDNALEVYGEIAYQWGEFDDPADTDMGAFGGYLGLEYTWDHNYMPYLALEIMFLEGDDGDDAQWQDFDGEWAVALIFEGDKQDHMQLENGGYGRVSLYGGLKQFGPEDDMKLDIILSYFWDDDDSQDDNDNLGWEADIIWTWNYTEDLRFELGFGWFFVDDDYADQMAVGSDDDDAWMLVWNTTLKF